MNVPNDLRYSESHEWLRADGVVGITDHAQHELTDVVFVDLPEIGKELEAGQVACVVESVKAASDIYAPVSGKVIEVNEAVRSNPALVNTAPYTEGWLFKIEPKDPSARESMKSPDDYRAQIG
jgi:glycine cleavage system H protein